MADHTIINGSLFWHRWMEKSVHLAALWPKVAPLALPIIGHRWMDKSVQLAALWRRVTPPAFTEYWATTKGHQLSLIAIKATCETAHNEKRNGNGNYEKRNCRKRPLCGPEEIIFCMSYFAVPLTCKYRDISSPIIFASPKSSWRSWHTISNIGQERL